MRLPLPGREEIARKVACKLTVPSIWRIAPLLIAALIAAPVIAIASLSFAPVGATWAHLADTVLVRYVLHTLILMALVGFGVLVLGIPCAWLTTLCQFPGWRFFDWALLLPVAMPAYVVAYTYTGLLDYGGPLASWVRHILSIPPGQGWWIDIRSLPGAALMLTLALYPYVYLLARAAFLEQSVCALEVARTLGYSPFGIFRKVALPLARPAIIAALALVLMETMGDFGTVQYFGVDTLATGIYRVWRGLGDEQSAIQLAAILLVFVFFLLYAERWSRGAMRFGHTTGRYRPLPKFRLSGLPALAAMVGCFLPILCGFAIPAGTLLSWAFSYVEQVNSVSFASLVRNSFFMAGLSGILILGMSLLLAFSIRLRFAAFGKVAVRIASMGYAIPGTVLAIGILIPLSQLDHAINDWTKAWMGQGSGLLLTGTLVALVYAYMVRFLTVGANVLEASYAKVSIHIDDAARSLGANPSRMLGAIHFPLLRGSMLTALILIFVDVLKELPATLILRPFNFDTLATKTFYLASDERLGEAAIPALAIALFGMIPVYLLARKLRTARPGTRWEVRP